VKAKLEKKGIAFTEELDASVIEARGIQNIPTLEVDGELIANIGDINRWINAQEVTNG
jgi:hypothetical protein